MTRYEYLEEVKMDVKRFLRENLESYAGETSDMKELQERLYDDMWISDNVTGNASGSYTFNSYRAQENLVGAWDLLQEALEEFGETGIDILDRGAEWCDVTIRCYLLSEALGEILEEMRDKIEETFVIPQF